MAPISAHPLFEVHDEPQLTTPVMVICLEGWVDAGLGATTAMATLITESATQVLVTFDGDHFLDQRARRPVARIVDGVTTQLIWPKTEIRIGKDRSGADVLYLVGPEPDFHWREFVDAVVGLSLAWRVRLAVGLGAFPAPAPHTRPVKLAATAPLASSGLVERFGVIQGEIEVPAGISAALELGFAKENIDVVSIWARVPHYLAAMPFPEASAALVDGLASISGLVLDSGTLHAAADDSRRHIDELIASNIDHQAMVRKLEETIDAAEGNTLGVVDLPSGDEIAAELERFLRGQT